MSDETDTAIIRKEGGIETASQSTILGVSVRAWMALMLVSSICFNHLFVTLATVYDAVITKDFSKVGTLTTIGEPLYSVATMVIGFFFGNKVASKK
jgi:hypothetical protein